MKTLEYHIKFTDNGEAVTVGHLTRGEGEFSHVRVVVFPPENYMRMARKMFSDKLAGCRAEDVYLVIEGKMGEDRRATEEREGQRGGEE